MRYGRRQRSGQKKAETFFNQFRKELAKEGLGKLAEVGGAAVGMLLGLASTRAGVGLPSSTAATGGAIAGGFLGVIGKSTVATVVDRFANRRVEQSDDRLSETSTAGEQHQSDDKPRTVLRSADNSKRPSRRRVHRPAQVARARHGPISGSAGSYLNHLRRILDEIETQQARLANIANAMRASQLGLAHLLTGGRSDRTQEIYTWTELTRSNIEEATVLTHHATKSLKAYLASL